MVINLTVIELSDLELYVHLLLSAVFFVLGAAGVAMRRSSVIIAIMSLELMFLSSIVSLISFSVYRNDMLGQVFSLFVLGVVAAEAVVGLAIVLTYYRNKGDVSVSGMNSIKG